MGKLNRVLNHFGILTVIYLGSIFIAPADPTTLHKYRITAAELHALDAVLAVPVILILAAAFYGYAKLKTYAELIKDSPDGRKISKLAWGLGAISYGLVFTAIMTGALNALAIHHSELKSISAIVGSYMSIAYLATGLILIGTGSRGLIDTVKNYRPSIKAIHGLVAFAIITSVVFSYIVFKNSNHTLWSLYHLPKWLIMTTIIIPYLYLWFIGLLASFELSMYTRKLRGIIYKKSWSRVALGLGFIMILDITLQILSALTNGGNNLSLKGLFFILLLMYILLAVGFLLIARGAKGLRKIEGESR